MKPVEHELSRIARAKSGSGTERRIVALRSHSDYRKCLRHLKTKGVKPVKSLDAHRLICFHSDRKASCERLLAHPGVAYVETDARATAHGLPAAGRRAAAKATIRAACPPKATWNVCRVKSPPVWSRTRGQGVKLAVIDTGIAKHRDLTIAGGVNTIGGASFADDNGHGTHVAGIAAATGRGRIYGNAPRVGLYAVKALDASGSGYISDIVEGIDWCIRNGIRVINMSFGMNGNSQALRDALKRARKHGIVLVASAGNEGTQNGRLDVPARYPETIAVAATTRANRVASFSSRGAGIDLAAPGVNILSTYLDNGYARMSGTSMSAPHVTGGAALLRALSPKLSASAVGARLRARALRIPGGKNAVGSGLLQVAPAATGPGVSAASTSCGTRTMRAATTKPLLLRSALRP